MTLVTIINHHHNPLSSHNSINNNNNNNNNNNVNNNTTAVINHKCDVFHQDDDDDDRSGLSTGSSPLVPEATLLQIDGCLSTISRRPSRTEHRQSLHDLGYGRIESYFKLQRLGKGTYATVYMGRSRLSNDLVALKEILKEHDEGAPCTAIREVSLLRLLRHNNIVTLHDICHTPKKLTLVFEYVGPDLYAYMRENNNLLSIHNVRVSITLPYRMHSNILSLIFSVSYRQQHVLGDNDNVVFGSVLRNLALITTQYPDILSLVAQSNQISYITSHHSTLQRL